MHVHYSIGYVLNSAYYLLCLIIVNGDNVNKQFI